VPDVSIADCCHDHAVDQILEVLIPELGARDRETERLRGIVRDQRGYLKEWQNHVLVTSRLLGCGATDKEVEAAIDELKHKYATARAAAIGECVEAAGCE
jgi:hypothetical protein